MLSSVGRGARACLDFYGARDDNLEANLGRLVKLSASRQIQPDPSGGRRNKQSASTRKRVEATPKTLYHSVHNHRPGIGQSMLGPLNLPKVLFSKECSINPNLAQRAVYRRFPQISHLMNCRLAVQNLGCKVKGPEMDFCFGLEPYL